MALQTKAKGAPSFRFYALYDKVYRTDVLAHAYARCRAKHGAAGVDQERFADIEAYGVERWLGELAHALRNERYAPEPVKRVFIPKPNGAQRPLGIPAIRDRVAQTAVMVVLESIFEPDLPAEQYAYRPSGARTKRSCACSVSSTRVIVTSSTPTCRRTLTRSRMPSSFAVSLAASLIGECCI
jgi:hypothetical protein